MHPLRIEVMAAKETFTNCGESIAHFELCEPLCSSAKVADRPIFLSLRRAKIE
jgi:hypothetical protein